MLQDTIYEDFGDICIPGTPCQVNPDALKNLRSAYLTASAADWDAWDKKTTIHKYCPKNIDYVFTIAQNSPSWLRTYTKNIKSLKTKHLNDIKAFQPSLRSLEIYSMDDTFKPSAFMFKKTMMESKSLDSLTTRLRFTERMLSDLRCLRNLRSLDLNLTDERLPALTRVILSLPSLESISLLLLNKSGQDDQIDSTNFLNFCEKILVKKELQVFKLGFDMSFGHYSTDAFEKLFQLLERSKIDLWHIQAMLAKDEVLHMAEKYRVFRETQLLAIHTEIKSYCQGGMTLCLPWSNVQGMKVKLLNIYLQENLRTDIDYVFDLDGMLNCCQNIQYLYVEWENDPLKFPINDQYVEFLWLKTLFLDFKSTAVNNWQHMQRIIEKIPFLERFRLRLPNYDLELTPMILSSIEDFAEKSSRMQKLKSLDLKVTGMCQEMADTFQILFSCAKGLQELTFSTYDYYTYNSPQIPLEGLINYLTTPYWLELQVLDFQDFIPISIDWMIVQKLIRMLPSLAKLREFTFLSRITFDVENAESQQDQADLVKMDITDLITKCHRLEKVLVASIYYWEIEYSKYPRILKEIILP